MAKSVNIIVVGAGPVGLTAALALRARGLPVLVVEADADGRQRPGSRALFLHKEPLQILDRMAPGLAKQIGEAGVTWRGAEFTYANKLVYQRSFERSSYLNYGTSLPQVDTETILYKAALEAGVEFRWSFSVSTVQVGSEGVTLLNAEGERLVAPYVVAADGARSSVRKALGIPLQGSSSNTAYVIADVSSPTLDAWPLKLYFHYRHKSLAGRNLLILPFKGGWRFDLQCKADDDVEFLGSPEGCRAWLSDFNHGLADAEITWVSTYRFRQLVARDFTDDSGRILLCGEAAHLFAPFGGRGLNSGIVDADSAAVAIATAMSSTDPAVAKMATRHFAADRHEAAEFNKSVAASGLDRLSPPNVMAHAKRWAAAQLAPWVKSAGRWLSQGPTGVAHGRREDSGIY
ncbi:FAD-dependent monooxygenase [Parvibaculum sp.]|uniref:FAD-dependent oxidoreductase n=1 Tax=Parvibaculum sp. TaxID=2024848 RepID=UPI0025FC622F|nr:FAD-dependent monooxygenase [Parvibaculum sp.]